MAGDPDLFHVTQYASVEDIFADGLKQHAAIRARQVAAADAGEDELDPMAPVPNEEVADRAAEELIQAARSKADVPSEWPRHADGVFFWPTKPQAVKTAENDFGGADPIVAVNSSDLPERATCVIGSASRLDPVFQAYWKQAAGRGNVSREDEDAMLESVVEWWGDVEVYTGQNKYDHEVWCDTDIPPEAIEWIEDPANGRTLYAPPDDPDQQRFIDLF